MLHKLENIQYSACIKKYIKYCIHQKIYNILHTYENIKILKFDMSETEGIEEFIENATKDLGGSLDCIINNQVA